MKNIKQEVVTWIQLITFIAIWVLLILLSTRALSISWEAVKLLPEVVTIYTILYLLFVKWAWRLSFLQGWLVPFPDLEGTWQGTLQTTWQNPETAATPLPIPLILVIKQSFETISCVLYTKESSSYSTAALLSEEDDSGIKRLSYVYTNTPELTARGRSPIHDGAAILKIITAPERTLQGEYWTNRKTTGTISLTFRSKKLFESFPSDLTA
jgi:hypothetical protein